MHVAVVSLGKSHGCTSTAVGLAMAFRGVSDEAMLVELDPYGGDLAAWWGLSVQRGVRTAIGTMTASSHDDPSTTLRRHCQESPYGFGVVAGPAVSGAGLDQIVSHMGGKYGYVLDQAGFTVVSDCGRWNNERTAGDRVRSASAIVAVMTPDVAGVERAQELLGLLDQQAMTSNIYVAVMGDRPYEAPEIAGVLGVPVRVLPQDASLVRGVLAGDFASQRARRKLDRTTWWRTMVGLRDEIIHDFEPLLPVLDEVTVDGE